MIRFNSIVGGISLALTAIAGLQAQVQAGAPATVAPSYSKRQGVKSEATTRAGLSIFKGVAGQVARSGDVPPPPRIEYQNGLLTIWAFNSTLRDVLSGVAKKTGIQIEGVDSASEMVAFAFGPAPSDVVLNRLLEGSRFDYIIIDQPGNYNEVKRVILSLASASVKSSSANAAFSHSNRQELSDEDSGHAPDSGLPHPEAANQPALSNYGPQSRMGSRAEYLKQQAQQQRNLANQRSPTGDPADLPPSQSQTAVAQSDTH